MSAAILPLELENLGYEVAGAALLRDISGRLEAGSKTLVLGPNGAGKSLLLRLGHGLLRPTHGGLRWCGPRASEAAGYQAMVFERPVLLRRSTAANVDYALRVRGVAREERRRRVARVLERTGLGALAERPARVLSAGERQRLALARAWALDPEVLWLDEPTAALDPSATRSIEALVSEIAAGGTKIVMTTHDLGQARRLGDEIWFLYEGRLRECGPAKAFFDTPTSPEARAFLKGELSW